MSHNPFDPTQADSTNPYTPLKEVFDKFEKEFLKSIEKLTLRSTWNQYYTGKVWSFANSLLQPIAKEVTIPNGLNDLHVNAVLKRFKFGLLLAEQAGSAVPDGSLAGHRILLERPVIDKRWPPAPNSVYPRNPN